MEAAKKCKNGRILRLKLEISTMEKLLEENVTDPNKLKDAIDDLEKWKKQTEAAVDKLYDLVEKEDIIQSIREEFAPLKSQALQLLHKARALLPVKLSDTREGSPAPSNTSDRGYEAKLPRIHIEPFDGDYTKWLSFVDVFTALVHNRANLTGAEKLQLLKNSLKGEAAQTIQYISVTNQNYDEAWEMLQTHYNSKRLIVDKLFCQLLDIKKLENSSGLKMLFNTVSGIYRNLQTLNLTNTWEAFLCYFVMTRLDQKTASTWIEKLSDEVPDYSAVMKFIEGKLKTCVTMGGNEQPHQESGKFIKSAIVCPACKQSHKPWDCSAFRRASVQERWNLTKAARLCVNCFQGKHTAAFCQQSGCKLCGEKHSTFLHSEKKPSSYREENNSNNKPSSSKTVATSIIMEDDTQPSLLCTASVYILDVEGKPVKIRALLDQGSQSNLITKECLQKLKLPQQAATTNIRCVGGASPEAASTKVDITIQNNKGDFTYKGSAIVLDYIMENQPQQGIKQPLQFIKGLNLADEDFDKPGPIEALLGVDLYIKACKKGLKHSNDGPGAQNTAFGWVLMGSLHQKANLNHRASYVNVLTTEANNLWTLQDVPKVPTRTAEDMKCEQHFQKNTLRQPDGRYMVRLPLIDLPADLGESRAQATHRFFNLERQFKKNAKFATDYRNVMRENLNRGFIEEIPPSSHPSVTYYIPHHAVIKTSSLTTKTRVVFDASARSSNGKSLNDNMLTGPRLQDDLVDILIRFLTHRIVITADIEKMYLMIPLHPEDRPLHRILWREEENLPLKEYQLTTVTFGDKSAPYLAIRTLHQLANDEYHRFPAAATILKKDFYVDNLLSGVETTDEAAELVLQLNELLKSGGFHLTQWASNSVTALQGVPEKNQSIVPFNIHDESGIKTLGLQWLPGDDQFRFCYQAPKHKKITKRTMLSDIGKLFDPLGWLAPTTIRGRIAFQNLWRLNLDWDTLVPTAFAQQWTKYTQDLENVKKIIIDRCVKGPQNGIYSLYGFCDSSESAYGACVYLKTESQGNITAHLVAAKSRVTSLHATPLPRLELCGALELAHLLQSVEKALELKISEIHAFTDSTITMQWITNLNIRWKPFVANRVSAIHDAVPHASWHHIAGKQNIADCISRGISVQELALNEEWWKGPSIIYQHQLEDNQEFPPSEEANREVRATKMYTMAISTQTECLINRFSELNRLLRVTAWIMRFYQNLRKLPRTSSPYLTAAEMNSSLLLWIKKAQQQAYAQFMKNGSIPPNLQSLNPFVDCDQIVRVGGRLEHAQISNDQRHPILIPKEARIARLIVEQTHRDTLHGGPQVMITTLRRKYWIPHLKNLAKQVYRQCIKCAKLKAQTCIQLMADLPKTRVTAARPFQRTGIDFMGPFWTKTKTGRGAKRYKGYVAIFICFTTRAIHLEYVGDLTTAAFLGSLRRFIARRGKPTDIFSDSGTNLVGGNNELKHYMEIANSEQRQTYIGDQMSQLGITWHFNPAAAPHFGGLWEAGVKSTKYHLKRIIGETALTCEELSTVLCQVEAVLNSRPLVDISDDPSDLQALTPGHFLIGGPLLAHPEPNFINYKESHLTNWTRIQKMVQHFWRRWHGEYLTRLQQRPKWAKATKDLVVDELVLLKEDNVPPLHWSLARITEIHPGSDGHVRVVTVRTPKGTYKRPITKICRLPVSREEDDKDKLDN